MANTMNQSNVSGSISHTVALDGGKNQAHFQTNPSTFRKIRVTIHSTCAWPNSPYSDNHVTILLILDEGGTVQIVMRTDEGDLRGQLVWKLVNYQHSSSQIKTFDFDLNGIVAVQNLYEAIRSEWSLHQYEFSPGGSGCHFWNYILLNRMASQPDRFHLASNVPGIVWTKFGIWYSRSGAERPNQPIRQGKFQNYEEWYQDWFGDEE